LNLTYAEEPTAETTSSESHSKIQFSQRKNQDVDQLMENDLLKLSNDKVETWVERNNITLRDDEKTHILIQELQNANIKSIQNAFVKHNLPNVLRHYKSLAFGSHKRRGKIENAAKFENLSIVKFMNYSFLVDELTATYITEKIFIRRMSNLISWLSIIQKSNEINMFTNPSQLEDKDLSKELIDWIVLETFNPKFSIPVTGIIRQRTYPMDANAFGVVQLVLIRLLSRNSSREMTILTSCSLILIWYERMNFSMPQLLEVSNEDKIRFLIGNLKSSKEKLQKKCKNHIESLLPIEYGEFQLPKEMNIPDHIIPKRDFDSIEGFETNDKLSTVKKIESFCKIKRAYTSKACHFQDVPVYLVVDGDNSDLTWIKISDSRGDNMDLKRITRRANSIIAYLILSHFSLMEAISKEYGTNMSDILEKSKKHFINWIQKELFEPEGSLPVFGRVGKVNQPYDKSKFGDIQLVLIYYFGSTKGFHILPNLSIGILGSWLKNYDQVKWKRKFIDDRSFATFMLEILSANQHRFMDFKR
jgi:hypothetical protein